VQPRHHLLDDSVLEHSDALSQADLTSLESAEGIMCDFTGSDCDLMSPEAAAAMQGCVRRKTVQKEGRKPAVASWQRYWLQIWANSLVYFPPTTSLTHSLKRGNHRTFPQPQRTNKLQLASDESISKWYFKRLTPNENTKI